MRLGILFFIFPYVEVTKVFLNPVTGSHLNWDNYKVRGKINHHSNDSVREVC